MIKNVQTFECTKLVRQIKNFLLFNILAVVLTLSCFAQDKTVSAGFSHQKSVESGQNKHSYGFFVDGDYEIMTKDRVRVTGFGNFSGKYNGTSNQHNILGGARLIYNINESIRPFAELGLGVSVINGDSFNTQSTFARGAGASVDVYLTEAFYIRPVHVHYLRTNFFNGGQNNYSTSTGVGFRF